MGVLQTIWLSIWNWISAAFSPNLEPASYYRRRFDLLVWPSLLINAYYSIFLFIVYQYSLVERVVGFNGEGKPILSPMGYRPAILQGVLLLITFVLGYTGISRESRRLSFWLLVATTMLFILTVSLPVYSWGGSNGSFFSPILATVSGLTVVFTTGKWTRLGFAGLCILIFIGCAKWYVDIGLNDSVVLLNHTAKQVDAILHTSSAVVSILATVIVGWQSNVFAKDKQNGNGKQDREDGQS